MLNSFSIVTDWAPRKNFRKRLNSWVAVHLTCLNLGYTYQNLSVSLQIRHWSKAPMKQVLLIQENFFPFRALRKIASHFSISNGTLSPIDWLWGEDLVRTQRAVYTPIGSQFCFVHLWCNRVSRYVHRAGLHSKKKSAIEWSKRDRSTTKLVYCITSMAVRFVNLRSVLVHWFLLWFWNGWGWTARFDSSFDVFCSFSPFCAQKNAKSEW